MTSIYGVFDANGAAIDKADLGASAIRHPDSGCTIAADASLYYRDDLRRAIGLNDTQFDDAELILAAYLRWGESCVDHLEGDFAFALWDPRQQTLICARDPYAMRPFYYNYSARGRFVFASHARDILRFSHVPFAINEGRIADYIVHALEWLDLTSTFYDGIVRLPPAHRLTIDASGIQITDYWEPVAEADLGLRTDEEFTAAFLDVFSRAVAERQRAWIGEVGTMLSGGMDSGSIAAVAEKPIKIYSLARRRSANCTESCRIYATLDYLRIRGTQIIADEPDYLINVLAANLAEPYDGQFLFLRAIYEAANRDGLSAVFDGLAGDLVFNAGPYIRRLLRSARFVSAHREIVGEQYFWGSSSVSSAYLRNIASAYLPGIARKPWRKLRQLRDERQFVKDSLISSQFADHVGVKARFNRMRATFSGLDSDDPGLERVRKIRPNLTAGRERYGRIAASSGIQVCDPYTDQRVVNFCSALPDNQVARNGWPKFLLRNAMSGRLPDIVRWGPGKPHIAGVFNDIFLRKEKSSGRLQLDQVLSTLEGYVDPEAMRSAWRDFNAGGDWEAIHRAYILSLWLDQCR